MTFFIVRVAPLVVVLLLAKIQVVRFPDSTTTPATIPLFVVPPPAVCPFCRVQEAKPYDQSLGLVSAIVYFDVAVVAFTDIMSELVPLVVVRLGFQVCGPETPKLNVPSPPVVFLTILSWP